MLIYQYLLPFSGLPVFSFCWGFPSLCKSFLAWWSPICWFCFCCPCLETGSKSIAKTNTHELIVYIFFWEFLVLGLTFKVFNPFWIHLCVCGVTQGLSFILLRVAVQFRNTIYWGDCLYPAVCSCLLCHRLIDRTRMGLFLASWFHWFMGLLRGQEHAVWIAIAL